MVQVLPLRQFYILKTPAEIRGGRYTLDRKRPVMVKEFRDQAYRLREGEVSQPFQTDFGWHIVTVDRFEDN